jgi:hypothetical protein
MTLWGWLIKFISGFLPVDGKRIGKLLWVICIVIAVIFAYHKIFFQKQQVTMIKKIEKQINYAPCPDSSIVGIKFNIWKLKLSLGV